MTEQEARECLDELHNKIIRSSFCKNVLEREILALIEAKKMCKEIQQYRELGTVEELKVAREKQIAKSRIIKDGMYFCPSCGEISDNGHCKNCGQKVY